MDITYIIVGLIVILFGIGIKIIWPSIQVKLTAQQIETLKKIANIVVYAAEQIFGAKMGADKLTYALKLANKLLGKKNLSFDEDEVRAAIEAQVKQMNKEKENGGVNE